MKLTKNEANVLAKCFEHTFKTKNVDYVKKFTDTTTDLDISDTEVFYIRKKFNVQKKETAIYKSIDSEAKSIEEKLSSEEKLAMLESLKNEYKLNAKKLI